MSSFVPKDATEFVVPKLKEGLEYKFRVMAENAQGLSEPLETEQGVVAKNPFGRVLIPVSLWLYMGLIGV